MIECMSFVEDFAISQSSDKDVKVVLCGDFNASVNMINSIAHLRPIKELIKDFNLVCCDNKDLANVGYTYKHDDLGHRSFIDHVYVSNSFESNATDLNISEHELNLFDQNAICFNLLVSNMVKVYTAAHKTTVDKQRYIFAGLKLVRDIIMNLQNFCFMSAACIMLIFYAKTFFVISKYIENILSDYVII